MKHPLKVFLFLAIAFSLAPYGRSFPAETPPGADGPRIEVHLYNDVGVPNEEVSAAQQVASRVFQNVGIALQWSDCTVRLSISGSAFSPCGSLGSLGVAVYLVGPLEAHFKWVGQQALGYSVIPNTHAQATMAFVSYPRIRRLSLSTSFGAAGLLGLAVAHEIGHLLFGSQDHANQGLMRSTWRLKDLQAKAWDEFEFTRDQSKRLRAAVRERLEDTRLRPAEQPTTD
jgi:hypothetical protein